MMGRFISADSQLNEGELGLNMFAYCDNNPVNNSDPTGHWKLPNWAKIAIGVAVIVGLTVATIATAGTAALICGAALTGALVSGTTGAVVGAIIAKARGRNILDAVADGFMWGTISGAASGAVSATPLGLVGQIAANVSISVGAYVAQTKINGGNVSLTGLALSAGGGIFAGIISGPGMMSKGTEYAAALALNARTIAREASRANVAYAAKSIARSAAYVSSIAWKNLPISFGRLAASGVMGATVGGVISLFDDE